MDDCCIDKLWIRVLRISVLISLLFLFSSNAILASTSTIQLNESEKQWLSDHPSIRLAVDIDWAPFEFIDADNNYVGMAAEYISLVSEKLGVEFEPEKEKPWPEVVESVKNRNLDMFSSVASTSQRREYVSFTRPYLVFPMVIVTSDQVTYVNGLKDLKNESVAVVRGYATQDLLEKNDPELKLRLYDNVTSALEDLSHGKVYAYIGNIATVNDIIKREGLTNIKISGETPYKYELSMAVRNDWNEFIPILQKALDSITEQERDDIYRNWIKLRYEQGYYYRLFWKALSIASLIVLVILVWTWRLSKEIKRRTEVERKLQDAHLALEATNRKLVSYVDVVDKYVITSSTDRRGTITSTSSAFCNISGYSEEELLGRNHSIVRHRDMPSSVYVDLWKTISQGKTWHGELKNKKKNGDYYWVHAYISPVFDSDGRISGYTAIREDITNKKLAEELSITDELTSLFNRRHFNNLFPKELARAQRESNFIGLMIIDIDNFKPYNDNYGHQKGDTALQTVGIALKETLRRASDYVFRIGGEEFAVVAVAKSRQEIVNIAKKIREAVVNLKIEHAHNDVAPFLTVSMGLKIHHNHHHKPADMDRIYRLADDALYQAKENGRNQIVEYSAVSPAKLVVSK